MEIRGVLGPMVRGRAWEVEILCSLRDDPRSVCLSDCLTCGIRFSRAEGGRGGQWGSEKGLADGSGVCRCLLHGRAWLG